MRGCQRSTCQGGGAEITIFSSPCRGGIWYRHGVQAEIHPAVANEAHECVRMCDEDQNTNGI